MVAQVPVKGIKRYRDRHGKWRCYHRKTGKAIEADYGTAEFIAEVQAIEARFKAKTPLPGSLGDAIKAYLAWDHFQSLAQATQAGYRRYLKFLGPMQDIPIRSIEALFLA
jgi:hypothetical protein